MFSSGHRLWLVVLTVQLLRLGALGNAQVPDTTPQGLSAQGGYRGIPSLTVYSEDFESIADPLLEWSSVITETTPLGARRFLGQFGSASTSLTLSGLPAHSNVILSFDLFVIRSWDGNNNADPPGPDTFGVSIQGGESILYASFCGNGLVGFLQSYPDEYGQATHPCSTNSVEGNTLGYVFNSSVMDAVYRIDLSFPHSNGSITIQFEGTLDTPGSNETWGLDNVEVSVDDLTGIPTTSTWGLIVLVELLLVCGTIGTRRC